MNKIEKMARESQKAKSIIDATTKTL